MAKKKPQHMYELLGQKVQEAKEAAAARPAPVKSETGESPAPLAPRRRFVPAQQPPIPAPGPVGTGHERALEDVITLRRDTTIVGILLVIVVVVVAFVVGRATAPTFIEDKGPEPGLRSGPGTKEENKADSTEEEADTTPAGGGYAERRFEQPGEPAGVAEEQPPVVQPESRYAVYLLEYGSGSRYIAEDWRKFLVDEGFARAEIKEKAEGGLLLWVPGYQTMQEAKKAEAKIKGLTRRGAEPFFKAEAKEVKR